MSFIDISSSPEPEPVPRRRRQHSIRGEVIELTDSEDDEPEHPFRAPLPPVKIPSPERTRPAASTSRQSTSPPRFPVFDDAPQSASTSRNQSREQPQITSVISVQSDDDEIMPLERQISEPGPDRREFSMNEVVANVLEIIPDVLPDFAAELVQKQSMVSTVNILETVLHAIFETPDYPKLDRKGKRKATEPEELTISKKAKKDSIDYGSKDRPYNGGPNYMGLALDQLTLDFPEIPKPYLRKVLLNNTGLYAPTYLIVSADKLRGGKLPYTLKKGPGPRKGKGKERELQDDEFDREREWLTRKLQEDVVKGDADVADQLNEEQYEETGEGIECGCCFTEYPFDKMIQCPEAHLFCSSCMLQYAETLLGSHDTNIICMDQSGCKLAFPISELRRFLTPKLMSLYERVKQGKEIEMAGLENLEECPFCEYKCVIENPHERLFRCGNEDDCGAITCRECKKPDHLPRSCKEMEDDKHLDAQHVVEEAMTKALMRNCPKCQKAFVKEMGCNKMTCTNCRTLSCYVCREMITGYEHFRNGAGPGSSRGGKCELYDQNTEALHAREVKEAADAAMAKFKEDHPDLDADRVKVDVPKTPPAPVDPRAAFADAHRLQHMPQVMRHAAGMPHIPALGFPMAGGPRYQNYADLNDRLLQVQEQHRLLHEQQAQVHHMRMRMELDHAREQFNMAEGGHRRGLMDVARRAAPLPMAVPVPAPAPRRRRRRV